jgi:hypothetical protein
MISPSCVWKTGGMLTQSSSTTAVWTFFAGVLAPEHNDVANELENLANLYSLLGRHQEARDLYQQTLPIREKRGPTHPSVGRTLNGLAASLGREGRTPRPNAEPLLKRSLSYLDAYSDPALHLSQ